MVVITTSIFPLLYPNPKLREFHFQNNVSNSITASLNPKEHQWKFNFSSITEKRTRIIRGRRWVVVAVAEPLTDSAASVVRKFYGGINGRDLSSVENLIADNCVYEDLVFPKPFIGRKVPHYLSPMAVHSKS